MTDSYWNDSKPLGGRRGGLEACEIDVASKRARNGFRNGDMVRRPCGSFVKSGYGDDLDGEALCGDQIV